MPKRVDVNQADIVDALRAIGCSVHDCHSAGKGFPDLAVGFRGRNVLLEVKSTQGKLTKVQREWHRLWEGEAHIVRSVEEAIEVVECG